MKKIKLFATVVAGALCLGLSLPAATAQAAESSKMIDHGVAISIKEVNDAADLEEITREVKLIEDKLFISSLCDDTIEEYFAKRGSSFIYDERISSPIMYPECEIGEPIEYPRFEIGEPPLKAKPDEELGDPLPPAEKNDEPEGNEATAEDGSDDSEESQPSIPAPTPAEEPPVIPGDDSERVAYLQMMRYYFGMTDRSLEEYAEYLRTEQGWDDEERLQYLLSLAFPDEYTPAPQPIPDDNLHIDGGESERVAYVRSMRYYYGMIDKSLAEYAEVLRNDGWTDEEWLQHILSLAFPDEYNTAPEPQPVPDDELEIVY